MAATLNLEVASLSVATPVLEVASFPLAALKVAMASLENNPPPEVVMAPLQEAENYAALESESPRSYPVIQPSGLRSTNYNLKPKWLWLTLNDVDVLQFTVIYQPEINDKWKKSCMHAQAGSSNSFVSGCLASHGQVCQWHIPAPAMFTAQPKTKRTSKLSHWDKWKNPACSSWIDRAIPLEIEIFFEAYISRPLHWSRDGGPFRGRPCIAQPKTKISSPSKNELPARAGQPVCGSARCHTQSPQTMNLENWTECMDISLGHIWIQQQTCANVQLMKAFLFQIYSTRPKAWSQITNKQSCKVHSDKEPSFHAIPPPHCLDFSRSMLPTHPVSLLRSTMKELHVEVPECSRSARCWRSFLANDMSSAWRMLGLN